MLLSCSCGEYDGEGWYYYSPTDFIKLDTRKRRRCCSCKELINTGADAIKFIRCRTAQDEIEEKIYGDDGEIYLSNWYMCESCGGIFLSLEDAGFCINLGNESMVELLKEYQSEYAHPAWESFKK